MAMFAIISLLVGFVMMISSHTIKDNDIRIGVFVVGIIFVLFYLGVVMV